MWPFYKPTGPKYELKKRQVEVKSHLHDITVYSKGHSYTIQRHTLKFIAEEYFCPYRGFVSSYVLSRSERNKLPKVLANIYENPIDVDEIVYGGRCERRLFDVVTKEGLDVSIPVKDIEKIEVSQGTLFNTNTYDIYEAILIGAKE